MTKWTFFDDDCIFSCFLVNLTVGTSGVRPVQSWLFEPNQRSNQLSWFEFEPNQRSNQIFELDFNILPNQSFYQISWFKLAPNQRLSQILGFTFLPNQSLNQIVEEIIFGFIYWVKYSHIEKKTELKAPISKHLVDI